MREQFNKIRLFSKSKDFLLLIIDNVILLPIILSVLVLRYFYLEYAEEDFIIIAFVVLLINSLLFVVLKLKSKKISRDSFFEKDEIKENVFLHKFFAEMRKNLDLRDLIDIIAKSVMETVIVDSCLLYLLDTNDNKYYLRSATGKKNIFRDTIFSKKSLLVKILAASKRIISKKELEPLKYDKGYAYFLKYMEIFAAEISIPIIADDKLMGILFLSKKKNNEEFTNHDLNLLKEIEVEIAISLQNALSINDLKRNYMQTIDALVMTIEAKDENTKGHSERVQSLALEIAKELNCTRKEIEILRNASILHDIGKISLDDDILAKSGKLTDVEYSKIKEHPAIGEDIISPIEFFADIKSIIRHHHERWDGEGYPDGLAGGKVALLSRILHVADSLDSMTHHKTYRKAKSVKDAIVELKECSGTQFDPTIIQAIEKIFKQDELIEETVSL